MGLFSSDKKNRTLYLVKLIAPNNGTVIKEWTVTEDWEWDGDDFSGESVDGKEIKVMNTNGFCLVVEEL